MIKESDALQHLDLSNMCLGSKVTTLMWDIYRSKSLLAVHLSDNEIPDKILRSLLFAFGIHDANEGDLFDALEHSKIDRYRVSDQQTRSFVPIPETVTRKEEAIAQLTNTEAIRQVTDQKTYLTTTSKVGVGRSNESK